MKFKPQFHSQPAGHTSAGEFAWRYKTIWDALRAAETLATSNSGAIVYVPPAAEPPYGARGKAVRQS